jgi:HK97 family phage portal protein
MNVFNKALSMLPFRKSIADAQWTGVQGLNSVGNISIEAASSAAKSLTPKQCYENSIPARAAISKIASSIAKATPRLFSRDGREIVGGPLIDLLRQPEPRVGYRRWVQKVITWSNISSELALFIGEGERRLEPLDPYRLFVHQPGIPNTIDDIVQWRYSDYSGPLRFIRADRMVYDRMFNPNPSVRGLSPFVTGTTEIGAAHEAARYRKQFFENSAIPSHLVVLPEGTSRSQREDFERRYLAQYGNYNNNAHRVMVASGKDVKVEQLEQPFQNSPFLDLSKWSAMQVALLFGVPPAVMQFDSTTKYDNANEQRLMFVEDTLMPQMELLQDVLQIQLIDPYFSFSEVQYADTSKKNTPKLTKAMEGKFEQGRSGSNIILLIDADTMPIMATVKADQVAKAKEMREVLMMSPKETADFYHFDIADRPERDEIYILNNYVCVTNDEINKRLSPQLQAKEAGGKEPTVAQGAKERRKAAKKKAFDGFTRKLRKAALDALDGGEVFALADADALDDDSEFREPIRVIRYQLKALLSADDPKRAVKDYFNRLKLDEVSTND